MKRSIGSVWRKLHDRLLLQRSYVPFVILGQMRTGSNLLRVALETSRQIRMENEIFNKRFRQPGATFDTILAEWLAARPLGVKAVGCKIFYDHLVDAEWSRLLAQPGLRVIHLTRRNRLRMFLSLVIAQKTDQWIEDHPRKRQALAERQVEIKIPRLITFLELSTKREEEARSRLAGMPVLDVVYEDMRDDLDGVMPRVLQFVGARSYDATRIHLGRQNPEPALSLIRNYAQVARALETSRWRRFLEED